MKKVQLPADCIMIGHSLGTPFILRLLEQQKAKAVFLAAGFTHLLGQPKYDTINKTFVEHPFDWKKIKSNCKKFYMFHGEDDPIVPIQESEEIARMTSGVLHIIPKGKHLSKGFSTFPLLLQEIEKEI